MGEADRLPNGDGRGEAEANSTAVSSLSLKPDMSRLGRGRREEVAAEVLEPVRSLGGFIA